ncbi:hypothetical protein [Krasilnikovia sp. MM14-A1259]|uniref:hypothetical protein n=1 Tax=Krasilnikovia sp. MM14-A1259 TaxID=3373539 RepID=UPI00399CAD06
MPNSPTTDSRPAAPVGLFLTPPHDHRPLDRTGQPLPNWYGIHPDHVARLIARYSRDGDTVLDLDTHPTVAGAARHLHRHPSPVVPEQWSVGLILASLPRLGVDTRDVYALSETFDGWQTWLRPGGFLVTLLTALPGGGAAGHRSTVIAAARAVGLLYHQHIPAVLVPLPEADPRTESDPVPRPPLLAGRHVRAHRDLLVFASTSLEATHV